MRDPVMVALTNLEAALERDEPGAVDLAERVLPVLWALAGAPPLVPPDPPLALMEVA